ncbi:MAG: hypothetical protein ACRDYW_05010 [Acidimicrobiales bacterium]
MPSTTSKRRRRRSASRPGLLDGVAHLVDAGTADDPGNLLVYVADAGGGEVDLGLQPVPIELHPSDALLGLVADPSWSIVGVRASGTLHHLDGGGPSERTRTTYLVDRRGHDAAVVRRGDEVLSLPGPAEGTLPDLCRRVLGLPTPPPPPTTRPLWTAMWLDRVIDAWGDPARRSGLSGSWTEVALLHPATTRASGDDVLALDDPLRLAALAADHAAAFPWDRLRLEPETAPLPGSDLSADVARWMDDGCFARWALGAFPPPAALARDLIGLLEPGVIDSLVQVVAANLEDDGAP